MLLCTGRVDGDQEAATTYHFRSRATRVDHMIAYVAALPCISTCCIGKRRNDSDHNPLELFISLPRVRCAPMALGGTPVRRARTGRDSAAAPTGA